MSRSDADLVIVGAGTVGGWASVFAREAGLSVIVLERDRLGQGASGRAAGMVRAQGGTPDTVRLGAWSIGFYEGQRARYGPGSARLGLRGTRVRDPRLDGARGARGPGADRDAARRRARRALGRARRGAAVDPGDGRGRLPRRLVRRDGRLDRSAEERPRVLARDAARRRGAAGGIGVHRAADPRRPPGSPHGDRCAHDRRHHRDVTRPADRRPGDAVGRGRGWRTRMGRVRAAPGRGDRGLAGSVRRHDGDGVRHRRRDLLAARGGRPALGHVEPGGDPGSGPRDRLGVPAADGAPPASPAAGHARARPEEGVGGDDRVHARPLPAHGPARRFGTGPRSTARRSRAPAGTA